MSQKKSSHKSAYARAGVDIDEMMSGLTAIKKMVRSTNIKGVKSGIGSFGGLFASPGSDNTLVASTDGVGTKLKVATMAGRHGSVGQDIVNHCVNDILVQGAKPLFFMDYLGTSQLKGDVFKAIVKGICKACRENGCALLGGETAEMPGLYPRGEYDLVGTIVGTVNSSKIITGNSIRPGDVLIGLTSSGLHTNGYSLARQVLFDKAKMKMGDKIPKTSRTIGNALLAVHKSYLHPVQQTMKKITLQGMAHITGGGMYDNLPIILPAGTCAVVDTNSWRVPPLFRLIEERGKIDSDEMYRVFNMGIGFVIVVRQGDAKSAMDLLKRAKSGPHIIGRIEKSRTSSVKLLR